MAALIVVLSVMNGFQTELRTCILGVASHIQITGVAGELPNWPERSPVRRASIRRCGLRPFVQSQAMFAVDNGVRGSIVRASSPTWKKASPISRRP